MKMSDVFALPVYRGVQEVNIHNKERPCIISGTNTTVIARPKYIEATIHAINNHDRMVEENKKLLIALCDIQGMCIGDIAMGYKLDPESIGMMIYKATGMTHPELLSKLSQEGEEQ